MLTPIGFVNRRRQIYLDEESYRNTVAQLEAENAIESPQDLPPIDRSRDLQLAAIDKWTIFKLRYTAGQSLTDLANTFDEIVVAYERWVDALNDLPDDDYYPPFVMNDLIDTYVDYLSLVSVAILLRREDLVGRICALNEGTDFDEVDAVLEELFKFYLPDRPDLDHWLWNKPYRKLLDAIDSDNAAEMAAEMKTYVKTWYADMKGQAIFWGKHEKIKPEFSPYCGYWAMCAGAFTYLYDIDDSSYRNETVYPKDLVDYARSIPQNTHSHEATTRPLRVAGGEKRPRSGQWSTPAKASSQALFAKGNLLDFRSKRRQIYLDEESYRNTVAQIESENAIPTAVGLSQEDICVNCGLNAHDHWLIFHLKYTGGESLTDLAGSLDKIVAAYEEYVEALDELPDDKYHPPFVMNDMFDTYVDYLNLLCAAILLRREDLVGRICALNEGTDFDQADAVLEELLRFFLPDRPNLDCWLWDKPYRKLLSAIDSDSPDEMEKGMKSYVKTWYADVRGIAHFWGKHQQIKPDYTPYFGYWAMCAGAFTYLYNIDDSSYRNETVYPKDLVDYARSIPRSDDTQQTMAKPLRVAGGEACPTSGQWFSPAKADSQAHFSAGTIMPDFPDAQYGLTIWQWQGN